MGLPIIGDIIGAVKDLASEVIVDKDKRDELVVRLAELQDQADQRLHEELMGQLEVNKTEAAHKSLFVAGWRPFIGWVGGGALAWTFIVGPLMAFFTSWPLPEIDAALLVNVVFALLGIGAMRSYDKTKGTASDALGPQVTKTISKGLAKAVRKALPENAPWTK